MKRYINFSDLIYAFTPGKEAMPAPPIEIHSLPGTTTNYLVRDQGYFPVIVALGGNEVLVALRGGAGLIGLAGRLDVVRSRDGGMSWEAPLTIADSERDDRNPALGLASDGTLVLAYHWQGGYDAQGGWQPDLKRVDTRVVYSHDQGKTWTGDTLLNYAPLNGRSPFGKIRCGLDGTLYMPIYGGPVPANCTTAIQVGSSFCPTYLLRSFDHGLTWTDPLLVALGLNEGDLLLLPDGDWLFAARSDAQAALYTLRSNDQGKTWGDLRQVTRNREHPPDLTLLANGYILLCFGCRNPPYGVQALLSSDQGHSWLSRRLLFANDLPGLDIGYPSTVRLAGGRLITVYYSTGTRETFHDFHAPINAYCQAVSYSENALLEAGAD